MIDILAGPRQARMPRSSSLSRRCYLSSQVAEKGKKKGREKKKERELEKGVDVFDRHAGRLSSTTRSAAASFLTTEGGEGEKERERASERNGRNFVQTLFFSATMPPEIKRWPTASSAIRSSERGEKEEGEKKKGKKKEKSCRPDQESGMKNAWCSAIASAISRHSTP